MLPVAGPLLSHAVPDPASPALFARAHELLLLVADAPPVFVVPLLEVAPPPAHAGPPVLEVFLSPIERNVLRQLLVDLMISYLFGRWGQIFLCFEIKKFLVD